MAKSSGPPSFPGCPYFCAFPAPFYAVGARGELLAGMSAGGAAPQNVPVVVWSLVAEPGSWFYRLPSEQSTGAIMIDLAVRGGGGGGAASTNSPAGTGVFLPEPRRRMFPFRNNSTVHQQPTACRTWVRVTAKHAPVKDHARTPAGDDRRNNDVPKPNKTDVSSKEIQKNSHAATTAAADRSSQQEHSQGRQKKQMAAPAAEVERQPPEEATSTAAAVDDFPELTLLPEEWVY